jgi:hypothetical protein
MFVEYFSPINGIVTMLWLFPECNSMVVFNRWGILSVGKCGSQNHDLNAVSCSRHSTLYTKLLSNGGMTFSSNERTSRGRIALLENDVYI